MLHLHPTKESIGEGISEQGALTGTTHSSRSIKMKGKDPSVVQPAVMTKDEFELIMSIFEKVIYKKTESLHHICVLATCSVVALIDNCLAGP